MIRKGKVNGKKYSRKIHHELVQPTASCLSMSDSQDSGCGIPYFLQVRLSKLVSLDSKTILVMLAAARQSIK